MIYNADAEKIKSEIENIFNNCGDFNIRPVISSGHTVYLANIGNYSGRTYIAENVIKPLYFFDGSFSDNSSLLKCLCTSEVKELDDVEGIQKQILSGAAVVFTQIGKDVCTYACMARNDPTRSVSEPESEVVVRGPREGFIEKAEDNVALLRKRLRTPKMKVLDASVGNCTSTSVKIVYIEGIADKALVDDVANRIKNMDLPSVLDSGYIEEFLIQGKSRLFTEVGNSEKPDKVAAKLAGGRVAVICDGSPVVLTVPYLFAESLQSAEDYVQTPYYATFIRIVRFISLLISLYLPAFYMAVMEHHKNAVPERLYLKMSAARTDVPFSIFGELIVILLIFELIREVGIRMPGAVGDAVSIVGGLILGDAAISAGISSAPIIMVASLTAISTFILPTYMNSTVLVRLMNILAARLFGVVGISLSVTFLLVHLCGKTSFGVPYMSPFTPFSCKGIYDSLLILPKKALKHSDKELDAK